MTLDCYVANIVHHGFSTDFNQSYFRLEQTFSVYCVNWLFPIFSLGENFFATVHTVTKYHFLSNISALSAVYLLLGKNQLFVNFMFFSNLFEISCCLFCILDKISAVYLHSAQNWNYLCAKTWVLPQCAIVESMSRRHRRKCLFLFIMSLSLLVCCSPGATVLVLRLFLYYRDPRIQIQFPKNVEFVGSRRNRLAGRQAVEWKSQF